MSDGKLERIAKEVADDGIMDAVNEVWESLSEFEFGIHLDDGGYASEDSEHAVRHYSLPPISKTLDEAKGTCLDIACLAKNLFDEEGMNNFAVFYVCGDGSGFPSNHCFNVVEYDGEFILVDASEKTKVKKYKSLDEIVKFYKSRLSKKDKEGVRFYKLDRFPPVGSSFGNFMEFATGCEEIK